MSQENINEGVNFLLTLQVLFLLSYYEKTPWQRFYCEFLEMFKAIIYTTSGRFLPVSVCSFNLIYKEDLGEWKNNLNLLRVLYVKAHSQVWDNFWQLKALVERWKILFISPQKFFSFSRHLVFCLDFLVM